MSAITFCHSPVFSIRQSYVFLPRLLLYLVLIICYVSFDSFLLYGGGSLLVVYDIVSFFAIRGASVRKRERDLDESVYAPPVFFRLRLIIKLLLLRQWLRSRHRLINIDLHLSAVLYRNYLFASGYAKGCASYFSLL
nr:hypothetical protein [Oedogonium sp. 260_circle1_72169]